jgi:hypothetical protein
VTVPLALARFKTLIVYVPPAYTEGGEELSGENS